MREGEPCRIITPNPSTVKWVREYTPIKDPSWYEPTFWLLVFSIFLTVTCALWYVVFRAIGIVV